MKFVNFYIIGNLVVVGVQIFDLQGESYEIYWVNTEYDELEKIDVHSDFIVECIHTGIKIPVTYLFRKILSKFTWI